MAFGFTLAFSRLGSVLNFLFTEELSERLGIAQTLWFGECKKRGGGAPAARVSFVNRVVNVCVCVWCVWCVCVGVCVCVWVRGMHAADVV